MSGEARLGQDLFQQHNCIACHHTNPNLPGSVGPPIANSSLELLEARILRAEYPPGYTPKQPSRLMPAQPFLYNDIPALAAFLTQGDAP